MMNRLHFRTIILLLITLGAISCSFIHYPVATHLVSPSETLSPDQESEYTLIDGKCNRENCLFFKQTEADFLTGVATVSGYYAQVERSAFEQTKQCDSFIVEEGPPALIQSLLSLIEQGNTVYIKNELEQPVVSLDLNTLTESEKQRLTSSSISQPVSIVLLAMSPTYQDAPVCFSHFEILRVE
jgi:hypothetical protein